MDCEITLHEGLASKGATSLDLVTSMNDQPSLEEKGFFYQHWQWRKMNLT